MSNNWK